MSTPNTLVSRRPVCDAHRALVLGALAVPGSTLAWDLAPFAGYWIGLPLGLGAILLGRRARAEGERPRVALTGIVLASLSILQMAIVSVVVTVF